jgi:hypothetical protein
MMMMMMALKKTGSHFPLPVPPEIELEKRLATLPDASKHQAWIVQHKAQVIADAQNALGDFLAKAPLPAGSRVFVAPAFLTDAYKLNLGYNLAAFAQRTGVKEVTFPKELPQAGQDDPKVLRSMAVAQMVPGFSHFQFTTDGAGNPQECLPVFVEPLGLEELLVANDVNQIHDPVEEHSRAPAKRGEFSLTRLGLKKVPAPLLAVPAQVRHYVAQVAIVQRLMHEVFSHNFGRGYAQGTHSLGHDYFYQWWHKVNGGRT